MVGGRDTKPQKLKGILMRTSPAKEEIVNFLKSGEPGQTTDIKLNTLKRAAQDLFTANGLDCPVSFMNVNGITLIVNREKLNGNGNGNVSTAV